MGFNVVFVVFLVEIFRNIWSIFFCLIWFLLFMEIDCSVFNLFCEI